MKKIIHAVIAISLVVVLLVSGINCGDKTPITFSSLGIQMASIPGGTFNMGSKDGRNDETVHSVTLSPFAIARYEVTYAQWMGVKNWAEDQGYSFQAHGGMGSEYVGGRQDEKHPVTFIRWSDAVLWCNALSELEGRTPVYYTSESQSTVFRGKKRERLDSSWEGVKWESDGYRLPTEAEWEYAARAGTTTAYSFGDSITGSDANYHDSGDKYDNGTTPVGSYPANNWGLYDMHGNVYEWVWDSYAGYSGYTKHNPRGSFSRRDEVVIRGGGWASDAVLLRSAARLQFLPDRGSNPGLGFRIAFTSQFSD